MRLHVSFHLWDDKPARAQVTPGRVCERKSLRQQLERGATCVGDRYFAEDYQLFAELEKKGCRFILRLCDQAVVQGEAELALRARDRAAQVSGLPPLAGRERTRRDPATLPGLDRRTDAAPALGPATEQAFDGTAALLSAGLGQRPRTGSSHGRRAAGGSKKILSGA